MMNRSVVKFILSIIFRARFAALTFFLLWLAVALLFLGDLQAIYAQSEGYVSLAGISGTVYRDYDADGTHDAAEPGVSGITVTAYDELGNTVSITTADDGSYLLTVPGSQARVEFTDLPSYLLSAPAGTDSRTTVVFVSTPATNVDVGLNNPAQYCDSNPDLATTCFVSGDPTVVGSAAGLDAWVSFAYLSEGDTGDAGYTGPTKLAVADPVGTIWGEAYQRSTGTLFGAAILKRHAGFGELGTGGIYTVTDGTTVAQWLDISGTLGIDTGADPRVTSGQALPPNAGSPSHDTLAFQQVGKISLGDIDISDDDSTLYVMSLTNRELLAIDIANKSLLAQYAVPDPGCLDSSGGSPLAAPDDRRPWAVKVHDGTVYIGVVCSAETSQSTNDLHAYVMQLDENSGSFESVFDFALDYERGAVEATENSAGTRTIICPAEWQAWSSTWSPCANSVDVMQPQPILSDIEFDTDGSMILGFIDRFGHQTGHNNYALSGTTKYDGVSAGDILRACYNNGSYTLESNADCNASATDGAGNNQGPDGGEYYFEEFYSFPIGGGNTFFHDEIFVGGLALLPGSGEVAAVVYDPFTGTVALPNYNTGGIQWYDNQLGTTERRYKIYNDLNQIFGKASGLGDLELLCEAAPVEIGNRVWHDTNGDGIQDADEEGLENVDLTLTCAGDDNDFLTTSDNITSTVSTDANGNYYFNSSTVVGGVPTEQLCRIQISLSDPNLPANSQPTTQDYASNANDSDLHDSDGDDGTIGAGFSSVQFTVGKPGDNDHRYDFGFVKKLDWGDAPEPNYPTLDANAGANHLIGGPFMGATVDAESDGQPNSTASGDDLSDSSDDEDGIVFTTALVPGNAATIEVDMSSSPSSCTLSAWIDFGADNSWGTAGDALSFTAGPTGGGSSYPTSNPILPAGSSHSLTFNVPITATSNVATYSRFRCTTDGVVSFTGPASDGEVEDYRVVIGSSFDFGDAPDSNYATLLSSDGPRHLIVSGFYLGGTVDAETNGLPATGAIGDDSDGTDDEDGVTFSSSLLGDGSELVLCESGTITVTGVVPSGPVGMLNAWIDWNGDGDLTDNGEQIVSDNVAAADSSNYSFPTNTTTTHTIPVSVPCNASVGQSYARFRFSSDSTLVPTGVASSGEVEDHTLTLIGWDFGDAPDSNQQTSINGGNYEAAGNGARHIVTSGGPTLGSVVDTEIDGDPTSNATGDDSTGNDDEDGFSHVFPDANWNDGTGSIEVEVQNVSGSACVYAWIDWESDGFGDADDSMGTSEVITNGNTTISLNNLPPSSYPEATNLRLRVVPGSCSAISATGLQLGGEVEDHQFNSTPLVVTLANFAASCQDNQIDLTWQTVSEMNNLGFNLYRHTSNTLPSSTLNEAIIPSQVPGSGQGAVYEWLDGHIESQTIYYYWLEDIATDGRTTLHGPISSSCLEEATAVSLMTLEATPSIPGRWLFVVGYLLIGLIGMALLLRRDNLKFFWFLK